MDTQDAGLVLHSDLVKRLMRLRVIKDQIVQDVLTELDERQAELDTNSKVSEADGASVTKRPPTLILREDSLVRLSGWANSDEGKARLKTANLDPYKYSLISLLAGTEVYVHSERLEVIRASENPDKPNPFLPSYLSVPEPIFSGFKSLTRQLSTGLNALFSVLGAGFAVYWAASTGAGYKRESAVLLGIAGGVVVLNAELLLLWIFVRRVDDGRKAGVEAWKGSSSLGEKEPGDLPDAEGSGELSEADTPDSNPVVQASHEAAPAREIRLRRRVIDPRQ